MKRKVLVITVNEIGEEDRPSLPPLKVLDQYDKCEVYIVKYHYNPEEIDSKAEVDLQDIISQDLESFYKDKKERIVDIFLNDSLTTYLISKASFIIGSCDEFINYGLYLFNLIDDFPDGIQEIVKGDLEWK